MKRHVPEAVIGLLLLFSSPAQASLDPETKKPYQLQIVLQIASNRAFTPLFQEQLLRDVQDQLKLYFGALARIEVTPTHPVLLDIETKGLDLALESWESLSEARTHFVLLDYVAGTYQIQLRFHDGMTGQAGALTQRARTNDRTAVASTVARLIESSFSPVGTVTAVGKKVTLKLKGGTVVGMEDVTLKLKGGALGVPMDRWVKRGHVFAVSQIIEQSGRQRAARVEWALLEVIELNAGVCRCRYWHRYAQDVLTEGQGTLGYRAIQLPTTRATVKVQVLDDTTLQPLGSVGIRVQRYDEAAEPMEPKMNRDGVATIRGSVTHLAWVQVLSDKNAVAQFPVALIEGRTIVARVKGQTDRESLVPLEARRDVWLRRVYDEVRMSSERALELSGELNQSLEVALESGRRRLPLLEAELKYLNRERDEISQLAKAKNLSYDLRQGEQQIDELRLQAKDLQAIVQRLERVIKEAAGSEKALGLHKLLERAGLYEKEAQFAQAIRLYEQVVQASPDQTKVKAHLDQLKQAWTEKGEKHKKARKFIYEIWPTLDAAELQKNLDAAKDALAVCREAGDKLTPQRLLRANATHTVNLQRQLDTLKRRDSEDDRNQAKALVHISEALRRLHDEIATLVGPRKD
jgi:tetratricopeptide (TPR) repeat protein